MKNKKKVDKFDCNLACGTIRIYLEEKIESAKNADLSKSYIHSIELILDELNKLQGDINHFM